MFALIKFTINHNHKMYVVLLFSPLDFVYGTLINLLNEYTVYYDVICFNEENTDEIFIPPQAASIFVDQSTLLNSPRSGFIEDVVEDKEPNIESDLDLNLDSKTCDENKINRDYEIIH